MNQEECLQIVRASTRARKFVMVQQVKSPSEDDRQIEMARGLNFKTSRNLRRKCFEYQTDNSSMKIKEMPSN